MNNGFIPKLALNFITLKIFFIKTSYTGYRFLYFWMDIRQILEGYMVIHDSIYEAKI